VKHRGANFKEGGKRSYSSPVKALDSLRNELRRKGGDLGRQEVETEDLAETLEELKSERVLIEKRGESKRGSLW